MLKGIYHNNCKVLSKTQKLVGFELRDDDKEIEPAAKAAGEDLRMADWNIEEMNLYSFKVDLK